MATPAYSISPFALAEKRRLIAADQRTGLINAQTAIREGRYEDADIIGRKVIDPLPSTNTQATSDGYLSGLLYGGQVIAYATLQVGAAIPVGLPDLAADSLLKQTKRIVIAIEAAAGTAYLPMVMRYKMDGTEPTASEGMPLGHLGVLDAGHYINLKNLKFVGIEAGKTHKVTVEFRA